MSTERVPDRQGPVTVEEREAIEARLAELYARDELELADFEARVEQLARAQTRDELAAITSGLPAAQAALVPVAAREVARPVAPGHALVPASEVPPAQRVSAVFSNVTRDRDWSVPRELKVVSVFGNSELDFRAARLGEGVTEVRVKVVFGNATLLVPPGVRVEASGDAVFGNFEHLHGETAEAAGGCTIRVSGRAVFGNVEIEERLPGESGREARRRWKAERTALGRREVPSLPPARGQLPPADDRES